jgi:hypothetical protein
VLANVYLHYVIDMWFAISVTKWSKGRAEMIRYADDVVFCFENENDARGFYGALKIRLKKFNLELSEEKSEIIKFGKDAGDDAGRFDFLGFTHITGKSRKGAFCVKRITSQKKLKAKRQAVKKWLRENMHTPIKILITKLNRKLQGHYNYYGMGGNFQSLAKVFHKALQFHKKMLGSRSRKGYITWELYWKIREKHPILRPYIKIPFAKFTEYVML